MQVLVSGAALSGANGLHFGPDGQLYVASVIGNELVRVDPQSGEITRRWSSRDGVDGPDDVAFAPDGSFYWTSILTGEVAGFRPDGRRVSAGKPGIGVNPLTFSDDGRLFVAQCFFGTGLFELDPMGVAPPRVIRDDLGPDCGLNGMDWGPDGRLYGPRWFRGEVVSIDVDSGAMRTEADGFAVPAAVKFDSAGRLHVLDTERGEVVRVQADGRQVVASFSPGLDNLAFDAADVLHVSSFVDGSVTRVNADGSTTELLPGGIAHPGGVALLGDAVVVADFHSVRAFTPAGEPLWMVRNILGVGELGSTIAVSADGDNLLLTSWVDNNVRVFDPTTRSVIRRYDDLAQPVSAVRFGEGIAVAEHGTGSVVLLNAISGERHTLIDGLEAPTGLAVDGNELYVTDRASGSVWRLANARSKRFASGLGSPEGIAVTASGLYIVDGASGRVWHVSHAGIVSEIARIAPGVEAASTAQPPSMIFNGIAAAADGSLFATGETDRTLYRITPR